MKNLHNIFDFAQKSEKNYTAQIEHQFLNVLQKSLYFKGKKFSTARVSIFFLSSWIYT